MQTSLVIPLWNEEKNIDALVEMLASTQSIQKGLIAEVVLVNNGSSDSTGTLLDKHASQHSWIRPIHLLQNLNYGGGVYEGCRRASSPLICYIPGDLQYSGEDLDKVVFRAQEKCRQNPEGRFVVKGWRTARKDSASFQTVSGTYTTLANVILGFGIQDVNGLPKLFHRKLLDFLPAVRMANFVFDAQLLLTARRQGWDIEEIPVTFYARRAGVSSWSGKRVRVYVKSLLDLFRVRALAGQPGEPLTNASPT